VAITEMARRVKNWGITKQLNAFPHFGCSDHRLEKTEQRFYTRAKAVVDLSGTFMHKSSQCQDKLKAACHALDVAHKKIENDVKTRWWSSYVMCESLIHLKKAINR